MPENVPADLADAAGPSEDDISRAMRESARKLSRSSHAASAGPGAAKPRRLRSRATYSDARDPVTLGSVLDQFVQDQGWQEQSAAALVMQDWAAVVGTDLAEHVVPVSFSGGTLVLQAESTAWATQVRLLLPSLRAAIDAAFGQGVVSSIDVQGPQGPTWVSGPRRVKGRGPRDTYG